MQIQVNPGRSDKKGSLVTQVIVPTVINIFSFYKKKILIIRVIINKYFIFAFRVMIMF